MGERRDGRWTLEMPLGMCAGKSTKLCLTILLFGLQLPHALI
jgi:hypothetical protein